MIIKATTSGITRDSRETSGRVRRMFAHSIQNWWWTAHPAAH
ncbi:trp operon leader peptide [Streptomyces scabiei]|nr:trp operon leader peptide [Streptomyces griseiscabiei]